MTRSRPRAALPAFEVASSSTPLRRRTEALSERLERDGEELAAAADGAGRRAQVAERPSWPPACSSASPSASSEPEGIARGPAAPAREQGRGARAGSTPGPGSRATTSSGTPRGPWNAALEGMQTSVGAAQVDWSELGRQRVEQERIQGLIKDVTRSGEDLSTAIARQLDREAEVRGKLGARSTRSRPASNSNSRDGRRTRTRSSSGPWVIPLVEIKGRDHRLFVDQAYAAKPRGRDVLGRSPARRGAGEYFSRRTKSGKTIWLNAAYNPILGPDGEGCGWSSSPPT